MVGVLFVFLEK